MFSFLDEIPCCIKLLEFLEHFNLPQQGRMMVAIKTAVTDLYAELCSVKHEYKWEMQLACQKLLEKMNNGINAALSKDPPGNVEALQSETHAAESSGSSSEELKSSDSHETPRAEDRSATSPEGANAGGKKSITPEPAPPLTHDLHRAISQEEDEIFIKLFKLIDQVSPRKMKRVVNL